jgi:predicted amidophosphoribosyltransferase
VTKPLTSVDGRCAACGAALESDQEWCIQCGAARTHLHRPPDWRAPATVIAVVIGVFVIAALVALVSLSIQANHG